MSNEVTSYARTPYGDVIVMKGEDGGCSKEAPSAGSIPPGEVEIIVTVDGEPSEAVRCLSALRERTALPDGRKINFTTVDCGADAFTSSVLVALGEQVRGRYLRTENRPGRMAAFLAAAKASKAPWLIHLDQRARVASGWLPSMLACVGSGASMVVPWNDKRILPPPGGNYIGAAEQMMEAGLPCRPPAVLPSGACFLVSRDAAEKVGWFNPTLGFGEGATQDLYMRLTKAGFKVLRADDCLIHSGIPGPADFGTWYASRSGLSRLVSIWGDAALKAEDSATRNAPKLRCVLKPFRSRKRVVFVFHEAALCGAVLAVTHICNGLIERGWDATFACTALPPTHATKLPMLFRPLVYPSADAMVKALANELPDQTNVIATMWFTVKYVTDILAINPNLRAGYFIQDDERMFRGRTGNPLAKPEEVEATYPAIRRKVVNSAWVLEEVKKFSSESLTQIGIGVDPLVFRPERREPSRKLVMAHCRPTTPRRGWAYIAEVFNRVARAHPETQFAVYDEAPVGLGSHVKCASLGQLSPIQVAHEMSGAHVFIEGSTLQGWGMQALEAMACGCALVTTDNRGVLNFVTPGHDCVMVPQDDPGMGAAVVSRLLVNDGEREAFGKNARQTAEAFDWESVVDGWEEWLEIDR